MAQTIEVLSFGPPDERSLAAASLLLATTTEPGVDDAQYPPEELEGFVEDIRDFATCYGLFEDDSLLGAATVKHGLEPRMGLEGGTEIDALAITPDRRGEGLGRVMLLHIAQAAIDGGDSHMALYSLTDRAGRFYEGMGFSQVDPKTKRMVADPSDVLRNGQRSGV